MAQNFSFENYPVGGPTGILRQVPFGVGSKSVVLIEIDVEAEDGIDIQVTVGNGPGNEVALDETADILDYVSEILRSDETKETMASMLASSTEGGTE